MRINDNLRPWQSLAEAISYVATNGTCELFSESLLASYWQSEQINETQHRKVLADHCISILSTDLTNLFCGI